MSRRTVIKIIKNSCLLSPGCLDSASCDPFITHAEAGKLLNTLLKLRQACCHPQVGSSGLRSLQQSPMTMEEILMVHYIFKYYCHISEKLFAFGFFP